jgi:suppressor for copper-sensitivity B
MMLASSLWLATLLSVHLGEAVSQIVMLGLTAVALVLFALKGQKSSPLFWLVVIALSAFGGYQVRGLLNAPPDAPAQNVAQTIPWQPLSEEAIENALAQGKRVFVDISADWCVTCKVNEHRVLSQPDVIAALRQPDVVALRGTGASRPRLSRIFWRSETATPFRLTRCMAPACLMARSSRRCWTSARSPP